MRTFSLKLRGLFNKLSVRTQTSNGDDVVTDNNAAQDNSTSAGLIRSLAALVLLIVFTSVAIGQTSITALNFQRVGTGLARPVFATSAPGDSDSLFVLEQHAGTIQRIDLSTGTRSTFATLPSGTLSTRNEQGLLGLAFHPDYQTNGRYYLNYTDAGGDTRVREYTRQSPTQGSPTATRDILSIDQPFSNHNAGWIGFGPDNYLYIATGDGGSGNDPGNNSQTISNNLLGKILRVDVDSDDFPGDASRNYSIPASNPFVGQTGDDEIYAYGLRNPYRCSFDRVTNDLWVGDVGQNAREEIDIITAGSSGQNFGWRIREGTLGPAVPGAVDPVYQYTRGSGDNQGFSVTGGYVYRGSIPELDGHYFFADFVSNRLWSFQFNQDDQANFDGTNFTDFRDWTDRIENGLAGEEAGVIANISSFGEDSEGNLLVVSLFGDIFQLNSATMLGDVNLDGGVDFFDIPAFISVLMAGGFQAEADTDQNGQINFGDIPPFIDLLISQ